MAATDGALRGDLHPGIWPLTARAAADGGISVGGVTLTEIAARYGTPAYVLDEDDVRQRCRTYRQVFPDAEIAYAGKAFLCRAMARWVDEEGLSLDVCSEGELAVATSAGFPAERIVLHGNAKTPEDLRAAMACGVGRIALDSAGEIARIAALAQRRQRVLVRVTPGVDAHSHPAVATGVEDQKFGLSLSSGAAADAVRRILAQPELELAGLHCHLGSQITETEAFEVAAVTRPATPSRPRPAVTPCLPVSVPLRRRAAPYRCAAPRLAPGRHGPGRATAPAAPQSRPRRAQDH
jgi:diaminopimelate decarboxylase